MDGLETLQNIKQQYPEIIVVMITGSPSKDNVKESIEGGASGFIVKPFNPAKVLETLKRAWNPRREPASKGVTPLTQGCEDGERIARVFAAVADARTDLRSIAAQEGVRRLLERDR